MVTDLRGKTLTFARPVSRVVCLIESALTGLSMLRQGGKVVGISTNIYQEPFFRYYARLDERIRRRELPAVGNWDFISLEGILALKPEVVILWSQQTEAIAALEEHGIPVFGVFIAGWRDLEREIEALGRMLGAPERAASLLEQARQRLEGIRSRLGALPPPARPRVYFMWAQSLYETSGAGSMVHELLTLAGGNNVCGHVPKEHLVVRLEELLVWNPEVIIMWPNPRLRVEDILAEKQWQSLAAVRNRRVYQFSEVFWADLWTLKYPLAALQVARWLHPERFADTDLARERRRFSLDFYGVPLDD